MISDRRAVDRIRAGRMHMEFQNRAYQGLFNYLCQHGAEACDDPLCPDEVRLLVSRLKAQGEFPGDAKKALIDTVYRFKSLAIDEELRKIQGELNDAEKRDDKNKRNELLRAKQDMMLKKKGLRAHVMEEFEKR
jgi:hypothetical protein